jgi:acetylornithine deacetylase
VTDWAARVLQEVDAGAAAAEQRLAELVSVPSVGGTDAEHEIQALLATELAAAGLEVDHWRLPLPELLAAPDFPGVEVHRDEAWGLVGRLPGTGDGPALMFDGHVDVVPVGDPRPGPRRTRSPGAWSAASCTAAAPAT